MPGLSDNDPPPPDEGRTSRIALIVLIGVAVVIIVALHLTGVVGPGSH